MLIAKIAPPIILFYLFSMIGQVTAKLVEAPFRGRRIDDIWFKLPTLLPINVTARLSVHLTKTIILNDLKSQWRF